MGDDGHILFDVFFSYRWRDKGPVEAVARELTRRGLRVFLDRWHLRPGQPWPVVLEQTLASCKSVAVFVGADGLAERDSLPEQLAGRVAVAEPGPGHRQPAEGIGPALHVPEHLGSVPRPAEQVLDLRRIILRLRLRGGWLWFWTLVRIWGHGLRGDQNGRRQEQPGRKGDDGT